VTTALAEGVCSQSGCPLLTEGRCLEGFVPPDSCPNFMDAVSTASEESAASVESAGETSSSSPPDENQVRPAQQIALVALGGDHSLSLAEASELMASKQHKVVLVAGEYDSGKTTLVVEIFAQFLTSRFAGFQFGGSATLKAIDQRHAAARVSSGNARATTERTQDEDMRLLHLLLGSETQPLNLLISDIRGELFGNVINGSPVEIEVPLAARADLAIVLVDGKRIADVAKRQQAASNARQLIAGLARAGGLVAGTRVAIVCSKADLLNANAKAFMDSQIARLVDFAERAGLIATPSYLSARPDDHDAALQGLESLLKWVAESEPPISPVREQGHDEANSGRYFWRRETST
jgi:hypothetical protein